MAENAIFGEATTLRAFEGINIVDALADKRAFCKHILVHVGNDAGIGVYAGGAAVQARIQRCVGPRQTGLHAWLQKAITFGHALAFFIVNRAVERMRQCADKLPRSVPRQLGVGVERDNVLGADQGSGMAYDQRETVGCAVA